MTKRRAPKSKPKRKTRGQALAVGRAALARANERDGRPSLKDWWGTP